MPQRQYQAGATPTGDIRGKAIQRRVERAFNGIGMPANLEQTVVRQLEEARDRADGFLEAAREQMRQAQEAMRLAQLEIQGVHVLVDHVTGRAQDARMDDALLRQAGIIRPVRDVVHLRPPADTHISDVPAPLGVADLVEKPTLVDTGGLAHETTPSGRHDPALCKTCQGPAGPIHPLAK